MLPLPRPPRLRARPSWGLRGWLAAALVMGLAAAPPSWAADGKRPAKTRVARAAEAANANGHAASSAQTDARRVAQVEAANIAELRSRMSSRDLALLRRADMGDARIDVWLYQPSRQYYVSVSLQGALRRTLKPVNEAEAWLNFDSFRRLAALGEVGRPVLLGQMNASGNGNTPDASPGTGQGAALGANTGAGNGAGSGTVAALRPGQDLRTVPVPRERLAAADDVDEMDLERVRQAREAYVANAGGAGNGNPSGAGAGTGTGTGGKVLPTPAASPAIGASRPSGDGKPPAARPDASSVVGQAVETLRRERIGDEVARLVWSADSGQFTASLTRQGRVVDMLRSPDRQTAVAAFDDLVRQAQARAVASAAH